MPDTTVSNIDALAAHSKASADPLRLNILGILGEGLFGVLELRQIFEIKQSSMSHHLKILANASLVTTRREVIRL
jgi:ArsR family transcriptional regulator